MRVLLTTTNHFQDGPGGQPRIVFDETVELVRRGFEVYVIAPGSPMHPEHELSEGAHLLRYVPATLSPTNPGRMSRHQRAATTVLQKYLPKVDAIHGHTPLSYSAALEFYGDSPRTGYTVHSPVALEMAIAYRNSRLLRRITAPIALRLLGAMEGALLRKTDTITVLSKFTIDCVRKIHGDEIAERIKLVPGWADTSRYRPSDDRPSLKRRLGWPADVPVFFSLRRLTPRMGLDRLLDAAAILRDQELRFRVVLGGEGEMRAALERQAQAQGLTQIVRFLGRVEDDDLPLFYAACDAFVLPTAELECFGLIALEALSAGRPVLATPVGAIPEIIEQVNPAWLARSPSAQGIAELLAKFLRGELDPRTPAALHTFVEDKYSRDRLVNQLIEVIGLSSSGRN